MNDHRVPVGEYLEAIRAVLVVPASDLRHVTTLYNEGIPLWAVLGIIASDKTITIKRLAYALVGAKEE